MQVLIPNNEAAISALKKALASGLSPEMVQQVAWLYERVNGAIGANKWSSRPEYATLSQSKIMLKVLADETLLKEALDQNAKYYAKREADKATRSACKAYAKRIVLGLETDISMFPEEFRNIVAEEVEKLKA